MADLVAQWLYLALSCRMLSTKPASVVQLTTLHVDSILSIWQVPFITKRSLMFLKTKLGFFPCLGLDSLASHKTKPWGLDPINPFSCDYQRTPGIAHTNVQNRCSELDKIYPFPTTLCPVLASKLFLSFTKILSPMQPILFQAAVWVIRRKVQGGSPAKMFELSSSVPATSPIAWELMICTLGETNLPGSIISAGTIPGEAPVPIALPPDKPWGNCWSNPLLGPPTPTWWAPNHSFKATCSPILGSPALPSFYG